MAHTILWEQIQEPEDLNVGDKIWILHRHTGQVEGGEVEIMDKWKERDHDGNERDMNEKIFDTYFRTDRYRNYENQNAGGLKQWQPHIIKHQWSHALPWPHNGFEPLIILRRVERDK